MEDEPRIVSFTGGMWNSGLCLAFFFSTFGSGAVETQAALDTNKLPVVFEEHDNRGRRDTTENDGGNGNRDVHAEDASLLPRVGGARLLM